MKPLIQESEIRGISIEEIISEVFEEDISYAKYSSNDSIFCPNTFSVVNQFDEFKTSDSYLEASDSYRANAFYSDRKEVNRRILISAISKRLERNYNKIRL